MKPVAQTAELRAATYSRYSSDQQRASSITDQQRITHGRASAEGWAVAHDYADAAISGADNQRPQYRAMLAAAARGEFDVLLLDDLSRLARDSVEQEQTIRRLEFQGIRIIAASDGYDSTSKSRKIQRGFKGLMNEMFLDDLAAKVHRGQHGQALLKRWNGGRPYGFRLQAITDPQRLDPYGQPARIGTVLEVYPQQAEIVLEIFTRFVAGESCLSIARTLNERAVPSPGSTWRRKTRRCSGWMGSAVRGLLRNPLFTGAQRWNVSAFIKDPDKGTHLRRRRPEAEWVTNQIESLRIVSSELFERAQQRTRAVAETDPRLKNAQRPRYPLSGLLVCAVCSAHYVMGDAHKYACSSFLNGRACSNHIRVRRDALEAKIVDPLLEQLRDPVRVAKMARELEAGYAKGVREAQGRAEAAPRELQELDERVARLRLRLDAGDPDMPADEIQAAIERAESKRRELQATQPQAKAAAKILTLLPKAAALYSRQIEKGLDGDPKEGLKARAILRQILGPITLTPHPDGSLWATYKMAAAAVLMKAATAADCRGRGDRI